MIITGLLYLIYGIVWVLSGPLLLLADVSLVSGMGAAVNTAGGYLSPLDAIIPVAVLVSVLTVFLAFESGYGIYKITMWVIRRIPTQS